MAQVAASSPHSSHLRVIRIVIPPIERATFCNLFCTRKHITTLLSTQATRTDNLDIALCMFYLAEQMPRGDFLGSLEQIVMLAVMRLGTNAYGMTVRREIEERTGREISIGAVYATLERLEAKGYVSSLPANRRRSAADARNGTSKSKRPDTWR
jgi:hypothetical protein